MDVPRIPRRLLYTFPGQSEIEYSTDIPTPRPEIKCDEVQVSVPPTVPGSFQFFVSQPNVPGRQTGNFNYLLAIFSSWQVPVYFMYPRFFGDPFCGLRITTVNWLGQPSNYDGVAGRAYICGSLYMTPNNTLKPRRDLLVGADRLINPTVDTPCPTWRLTGGNCPPNSLDCGNCCLDCASVVAGINGVTTAVLPISTWRKRP